MAVVYKARDLRLNRVVALKMILAGAHASPAERARFRTEAEAIARVQHADIVQIYEVGEHDGLPFLSLEFCPGGSLEQALAGTPLAAPEAAAVLERLARAVAAAHAVGIVHRDLKVTQGQWQAVMGSNPSHFSRKGNGRTAILDISDEELKLFPVEMVSWDNAQEFIQKLNEKERASGYLYRLPTEAEWEYACRGGALSEDECSYHFYFDKPTNDLSSEQANFNGTFPFGNAPKGKYLERPTRVGIYPPNRLGLCDMHGNMWQVCAYELQQGVSARVVRGGSWCGVGTDCLASLRNRITPAYRHSDVGFHLVRVPVR
jgi:serine/threonine protein kinase